LDTFITAIDQYVQGQSESYVNFKNGVRTANRGSGDIIAILIRRGRELGVPSFTDIRDAVLTPTPPKCLWNTWTDTATCNATALFKKSALPKLKSLYKTPGDVELIVGSLLSDDRVPEELSPELNRVGIDRTQAYLIFGELERIMQKDVFGLSFADPFGTMAPDSYFARFYNDDPNPFGFASVVLGDIQSRVLSKLILDNSGITCIQSNVFTARAGLQTVADLPRNLFSLVKKPGQSADQRLNCDISFDTRESFRDDQMRSYDQIFCGDPENCFRPSLPYCV
jgi:hypothetical protein